MNREYAVDALRSGRAAGDQRAVIFDQDVGRSRIGVTVVHELQAAAAVDVDVVVVDTAGGITTESGRDER